MVGNKYVKFEIEISHTFLAFTEIGPEKNSQKMLPSKALHNS